MRQRRNHLRGAARTQAAERSQGPWMLAILAGAAMAMFGMTLVHAQTPPVPEVVRPRTDSPTLPPTGGPGASTTPPRSENPLSDSGTARPIPDTGVITPPPAVAGSTPVIRPPAMGTMPVIPPPGSAGGDRTVVPK